MYPIALEKQYQKFFLSEFRKLAVPFRAEILKQLKIEIKADSDDAVRADSVTQMQIFMSDLRRKYGDKINTKTLEGQIRKNFALIDAWSRDKTNEALGKIYARYNTPQPSTVTKRVTPKDKNGKQLSGELWMQKVTLRNNLNEGLLDDVVSKNVGLIDKAFRDYFDSMSTAVKNGVLSGKGHKAIADDLMKITGVHESKAKFWARDQASKFFGETTRLRQKEAGIPGYIWRCVGDSRTRDTHIALEGTYHDWNKAPIIDGRECHAGMDFNCRCYAEPAMGPEAAEREYKGPLDDNYFENIRPGTEPAKWSEKEGIRQRLVIDVANPVLKSQVETAIDEIEKVLGIDPKIIKKVVTVTEIPPGSPSAGVDGLFSPKSTAILLNPDAVCPEATFMHEFMHWLDMKVLKDSAAKASLLEVIKGSSAYKNITNELAKKSLTKEKRNRLKYLQRDEELLARAFEQYIIDYKGLNAQLKDSLTGKKAKSKSGYWLDSDIKKIYVFFDALFIKAGLFK